MLRCCKDLGVNIQLVESKFGSTRERVQDEGLNLTSMLLAVIFIAGAAIEEFVVIFASKARRLGGLRRTSEHSLKDIRSLVPSGRGGALVRER